MALTGLDLVGYLRAEFAKASRWRTGQFLAQVAIAVPAALSVVLTDEAATYILAVLSGALLAIWFIISTCYGKVRDAAHTARRASLIVNGLGKMLSAAEAQALEERMTVEKETAQAAARPTYYASTLPPGPARLGDLIEESAFYTAPLQRTSAGCMLFLIIVFVVLAGALVTITGPMVDRPTAFRAVRFLLAAFSFAMSADVAGAWLAHRNAAQRIDDIRKSLRLSAPTELTVLLAMSDYSSAVESAPENVPLAYKFKERALNDAWDRYKRQRDEERGTFNQTTAP